MESIEHGLQVIVPLQWWGTVATERGPVERRLRDAATDLADEPGRSAAIFAQIAC
jgi:hypothetical protein